jgi:hypothetical protein
MQDEPARPLSMACNKMSREKVFSFAWAATGSTASGKPEPKNANHPDEDF